MTVYVDALFRCGPTSRWPYTHACHMLCDGDVKELHQMAARIGLKRSWFQGKHVNPALHHYDVTASKRTIALRYGAKEITGVQFSELIKRRTEEAQRTIQK